MHCLSGVQYLFVCYTVVPGSFKVPGQPGARPVMPTTGIWLRALSNSYVLNAYYGIRKCNMVGKILQAFDYVAKYLNLLHQERSP